MRLILATLAFAVRLCAADPDLAGSKVCAECHAGIYRTYARTSMAMSSGAVGTGMIRERFDKARFSDRHSTYSYSVNREGHNYFFEFKRKDNAVPIRRPLAYFVGSGSAARSYLISVDGFLYEAPVAYYSSSGAWDLSPGYDRYSYPYLTRAIAPGCLECHASRLQAIPRTQNGYAAPPFLEGGISCERCHGPGGAHAAAMKAGKKHPGFDIVNPAALEPERRDSICSQCHLSGVVRVDRAKEGGNPRPVFVPGEKLSNYTVAFVRPVGPVPMKVTSHVENLAQSACKRAAGDRMWCVTCHDPHFVPRPAEKAGWFRAKCLTCHAPVDCKGESAARHANTDDCTACHMPRSSVADAEHVVYTDHSIPRRPASPKYAETPADAPLVPFGQKTADVRDLGLAYAIVALRERNATYGERAFELLRSAVDKNPDDSETLSYLADLYKKRSDDRNAIRLYERLLRIDPSQTSAPLALGAYQMERGNYDEAIRLWKAALSISPALVLVRANLAVALLRTGRPAEAQATLEKALEFSPSFPAGLSLLDRIRRSTTNPPPIHPGENKP